MNPSKKTIWEHNAKSFIIRLLWVVVFLALVFIFVYRYCEQAGELARRSCVAAMIGSIIAGATALGVVLTGIWQESHKVVVSVMIAGAVRLLIGFIAVAVTLHFVMVSYGWFLSCYGIFYTAFVIADTFLIVRLFKGRVSEKDDAHYEHVVWRTACERKRCRRDYQ